MTAPETAEAQFEGKRTPKEFHQVIIYIFQTYLVLSQWPYLVSTPFPHCSRERKICTSVLAETWALREVATFVVAFQAQSFKKMRFH